MKLTSSKTFLGAILVIVIGLAVWMSANKSNQQEQSAETQPALVSEESRAQAENKTFHPISLPALAEKNFDGRDLTLGPVQAETAAYTRYYITYRSGELKISGIMNVPKGTGPYPVLILNHGYIDPAIYTNGRGLKREQDYLANRGYVVIHPDYRNHAQSDKDPNADVNFRLGYVEDVINAVYAVKNSSFDFLDKDRIGMLGHSMGGGITQNILVAKPDLIDAAVLFAPVSTDNVLNFNRWTARRPELAARVVEAYGTPESNPDFWHNISAINFLDQIEVPVMLHHGTADADVPIEWSDTLNEKMNGLHNDEFIYHVYKDQPHEFTTSWGQVMQRTVEFFDQYLK